MPDPSIIEHAHAGAETAKQATESGAFGALWQYILGAVAAFGAGIGAAIVGKGRGKRKPREADPPPRREQSRASDEMLIRMDTTLRAVAEDVRDLKDSMRSELDKLWEKANGNEIKIAEMRGAERERERHTPLMGHER